MKIIFIGVFTIYVRYNHYFNLPCCEVLLHVKVLSRIDELLLLLVALGAKKELQQQQQQQQLEFHHLEQAYSLERLSTCTGYCAT